MLTRWILSIAKNLTDSPCPLPLYPSRVGTRLKRRRSLPRRGGSRGIASTRSLRHNVRVDMPTDSVGCAECLAIVRALADTDPVTSRGGILSDWYECDLCGAHVDYDYRKPRNGREDIAHRDGCLWVRATAHAKTHAPPVALEHDRIPYGDGITGDACFASCPACIADGAT